jgi:hypothetical protein
MFSYFINKLKMMSTFENYHLDKCKLPYDYDIANQYKFDKPIKMNDSDFWRVSKIICDSSELFLHQKTNLILAKNGRLLGRYINGEFIDIEKINNKEHIIYWYAMCQ